MLHSVLPYKISPNLSTGKEVTGGLLTYCFVSERGERAEENKLKFIGAQLKPKWV